MGRPSPSPRRRTSRLLTGAAVAVALLHAACAGATPTAADVDALDVVTDEDARGAEEVGGGDTASAAGPELADSNGLAIWVARIEAADGPVDGLWLEVETGGDRFPIGADPATPPLWRVPPAAEGPPTLSRVTTFAVDSAVTLDGPAWLLARAPGTREVTLTLRAWRRASDGDTLLAEGTTTVRAGEGRELREVMPTDSPVAVWIRARAGVAPLPDRVAVGILLDGGRPGLREPVDALVAGLGGRSLWLKRYQGARPWLLRPGCDSDARCAPDGESYPCVSTCACRCDADACDCDFSGLEASTRSRALATARQVYGADAPEEALSRARVHYVFKRSLGGTRSCDANGELDVAPATYAAFFRAALEAAHRVNVSLGFPLIAAVSPQNESNHPLQDGRHRNAAGMLALGGDGVGVPYVDLIERQSCDAEGICCVKDRYLVEDPDSAALLAAALVAARAWEREVERGPDAALAPEPAMSVYLDSEQVDPIATDAQGDHPSIVTPAPQFFDELAAALAATPGGDADPATWASSLIFVDTYPGSWAPPWLVTEDEVVHHFDPVARVAMRYEAVRAADRVTERARAAIDAFEARFGVRPRYLLGETGWATFDGDEAAQARFVRRFFARAGELATEDPRFGGFIWFKDSDRLAPTYPSWVEAADPLTGDVRPCDTWLLSRVACAAEILLQMEGQWGLFRWDGDTLVPKPAWTAWVEAATP